MTPVATLGSAFAIGALCGLAALINSRKIITNRRLLAAFLYSGMTGLVCTLFLIDKYGLDNPYFPLAMSGMVGFGGISLYDIAVAAIKKSGISILFAKGDDDDKDSNDHGKVDT